MNTFVCLYTKQKDKKRKTWSDGKLCVDMKTGSCSLHTNSENAMSQKVLESRSMMATELKRLQHLEDEIEIEFEGFIVTVDINSQPKRQVQIQSQQKPINQNQNPNLVKAFKMPQLVVNRQNNAENKEDDDDNEGYNYNGNNNDNNGNSQYQSSSHQHQPNQTNKQQNQQQQPPVAYDVGGNNSKKSLYKVTENDLDDIWGEQQQQQRQQTQPQPQQSRQHQAQSQQPPYQHESQHTSDNKKRQISQCESSSVLHNQRQRLDGNSSDYDYSHQSQRYNNNDHSDNDVTLAKTNNWNNHNSHRMDNFRDSHSYNDLDRGHQANRSNLNQPPPSQFQRSTQTLSKQSPNNRNDNSSNNNNNDTGYDDNADLDIAAFILQERAQQQQQIEPPLEQFIEYGDNNVNNHDMKEGEDVTTTNNGIHHRWSTTATADPITEYSRHHVDVSSLLPAAITAKAASRSVEQDIWDF